MSGRRRSWSGLFALALALALALAASVDTAEAHDRAGAGGGGSACQRHRWGYRTHRIRRPRPGDGLVQLGLVGLVTLFAAGIGARSAYRKRFRPWLEHQREGRRLHDGRTLDLTQLRLAIDWRARRYVEARVAAETASLDLATPSGASVLLVATARALLDVELAWLLADATNYRPLERSEAEKEIRRLTDGARTPHAREVVDERGGPFRVVTIEPIALRGSHGADSRVGVITLVVGARSEICDVFGGDAAGVRTLLAQLSALPAAQLSALEIVWTPETADEVMSLATLESRYPAMVDVRGIVGRTFCRSCDGPYAIDLAQCPLCGAPA